MPANRIVIWAVDFLKRILAHRQLPFILAIIAVAVMLPALKLGLAADDLPQRAIEHRPDQLPPRMAETGYPADSGKFSTVLFDLFGLGRNPQSVAVMKDYGTLPWWTPNGLNCSLCRPVAALTHWMDYRLFPNSPALMHAHNIAWFAAVVFLITIVYRKLMGTGWAAGLAALLFLLDANTFIPAAFVANRGYFLALFFGLLCLYEHHQWRSTKSRLRGRSQTPAEINVAISSDARFEDPKHFGATKARSAMWLSALFLALSILGEESGVSMFAFILAYALVLETGNVRSRALTILPSALVITVWWIAYKFAGYGVNDVSLYLDPAQEPLRFLRALIPRDLILLGSQLIGLPPEIFFAIKPSLYPAIVAFYGVFAVAALAIFLPWVRRDKMTAYWFVAMILAAIPEAVLVPWTKNMGFIAIGAFGLIASFVGGVISRPDWLLERSRYRILAWTACALLILVHGPGAIAKRIAVVEASPAIFAWAGRVPPDWPNLENENLIIVNHPLPLESIYVPGFAAYYHRPLPKTLRVLVPACTGFDVQRTDDRTLVIQSKGPDIFSCNDVGPVHIAYTFNMCDRVLLENPQFKKGDRFQLKGLTVEILKLDASGLPSRVAFHFDASLDSPDFRWLWFDWRTASIEPFKVPAIGQSVTLPGPKK